MQSTPYIVIELDQYTVILYGRCPSVSFVSIIYGHGDIKLVSVFSSLETLETNYKRIWHEYCHVYGTTNIYVTKLNTCEQLYFDLSISIMEELQEIIDNYKSDKSDR